MKIQEEPNFFRVLGSSNLPKIKIRRIVESIDFFPMIDVHPISHDYCFTVIPHAIPDFFVRHQLTHRIHYSKKEIEDLFKHAIYKVKKDDQIGENPCDGINEARSYVAPAFNQLLSELLSDYAGKTGAVVEIGSGVGYTIAEHLSDRLIRTQVNKDQGLLLAREGKDTVYRISIQDFPNLVKGSDKTIPLIFALKVFDTLSQKERKKALSHLSQVQQNGDKLLILLDSPPCICEWIEDLEKEYSGCGVYPFIPHTHSVSTQLRFILVPDALAQRKRPTGHEINQMDAEDRDYVAKTNQPTDRQKWLSELHKQHQLQVINRLTFFKTQMKAALNEAGYHTQCFYDASCIRGTIPAHRMQLDGPFIYKSVSDTLPIRDWDFSGDERGWLGFRSIDLPNRFTVEYGKKLPKGEHLLGAEIFVIEATKI